ncbi:DUF5316 family protein [Sutcliffiella horikoshii]|uniref:DUF5316 family protein n=1 Tax=Sutcliffiella horikoshii TaxID=79883 RepID=UPI00384E1345
MIQVFLIIGIIVIIISGMFLGVWTSGQQQRANYHSETKEHRDFRLKVGIYAGIIGLASLGLAGLLFYI